MAGKRAVENRLEEAEQSRGESDEPDASGIAFRDDHTGELVDGEGVPVDPDSVSIVINDKVVMSRERAEEEDREILGPATAGSSESDAVQVAGWDA